MAHPRRVSESASGVPDSVVNTNMKTPDIRLSRISKLLIDRTEITTEEALVRRELYGVTLRCGPDVEQSRTLQVAVLTAANIANRCFPGAVRIELGPNVADTRLLLWPSLHCTFGQALVSLLGPDALIDSGRFEHECRTLIFGNAPPTRGALRVTFDGWIAKVGPAANIDALPQREYCSLSGVLAGALAISELFLSFADLNIEAGRRIVGVSLWRPDLLDLNDEAALGRQVEFLPREFWALGLGHLGNAYLWSLATLPYLDSGASEIFLNDFDRVEPENVETGLIFNVKDAGSYKTRVCSQWLEDRGFQTRLIERRFDSSFRCRDDEPRIALCGFDSNPARRDLATARFLRVMESGLGGTTDNFDTISFHTLPNPRRAEELWPDLSPEEETRQREQRERVGRENPAYAQLGNDQCGRAELAGKSVAVPFVGAAAATLVVAETIRLLHGGPAYTDIKLVLSELGARYARTSRNYSALDLAGLNFCDAGLA
jgi:hypothetical protein